MECLLLFLILIVLLSDRSKSRGGGSGTRDNTELLKQLEEISRKGNGVRYPAPPEKTTSDKELKPPTKNSGIL